MAGRGHCQGALLVSQGCDMGSGPRSIVGNRDWGSHSLVATPARLGSVLLPWVMLWAGQGEWNSSRAKHKLINESLDVFSLLARQDKSKRAHRVLKCCSHGPFSPFSQRIFGISFSSLKCPSPCTSLHLLHSEWSRSQLIFTLYRVTRVWRLNCWGS